MPALADHTVDLGHMDGASQATSGLATQAGEAVVEHICTLLSTNATGGATVSVRNENGDDGLISASVPADLIPSVTGAVNSVTPNYGLCVASDITTRGDYNYAADGTTVLNATLYSPRSANPFPIAQGMYLTSGDCTSASSENVIGLNDAVPTTVWRVSDYTLSAFATILVKAGVSPTQPAHNDYSDTLTFVATATY
jgi:hypothetical protein